MLAQLNQSKAGKGAVIGIAVLIVAAAAFVVVRSSGGSDDRHASDKDVQAAAQKQLDVIQNENLPPALKAQLIAHQQGLMQSHSGGTPPPPAH